MTDLTPNHPAVETMLWHEGQYNYGEPPETWPAATRKAAAADFADKLMHALPHLTAEDIRDTPVVRMLMAEAWDEGARFAQGGRVYNNSNPYLEDDA